MRPIALISYGLEALLYSTAGYALYRCFQFALERARRRLTALSDPERVIDDQRLSDEQYEVFRAVEHHNRSTFITGQAGTGKTLLLRYIAQKTSKHVVILTPTGSAALALGGQTIHAFFGLPHTTLTSELLAKHVVSPEQRHVMQAVEMVLIDDVSLVRADVMHAMNTLFQRVRHSSHPFGGVQIVAFGDVYQLLPLSGDAEFRRTFTLSFGGLYFFNAPSRSVEPFVCLELREVHRQHDAAFALLLGELRRGRPSPGTLEKLNQRVVPHEHPDGFIPTLCTQLSDVSSLNTKYLVELPSAPHTYHATIIGSLKELDLPVEHHLVLKEGAQVVMHNHAVNRWSHGTVGDIVKLSPQSLTLEIHGKSYTVRRETWKSIRYTFNPHRRRIEKKVHGSFEQFPLRLAWATTIKKAHASTFETVALHLGNHPLAHGEAYVALSRCRSLAGVFLSRPLTAADFPIEPLVHEFAQRTKPQSTTIPAATPAGDDDTLLSLRAQMLDLLSTKHPRTSMYVTLLAILTAVLVISLASSAGHLLLTNLLSSR